MSWIKLLDQIDQFMQQINGMTKLVMTDKNTRDNLLITFSALDQIGQPLTRSYELTRLVIAIQIIQIIQIEWLVKVDQIGHVKY